MTPAEAQKALDEVRVKRPAHVRLRVVGSIDNPQSDGPGSKLQNARLEQNLSVVQVAQALKLRPDQVAAMETMNFSKLPGLGYGLGYVRAYAELVDLDDVKSLVAVSYTHLDVYKRQQCMGALLPRALPKASRFYMPPKLPQQNY